TGVGILIGQLERLRTKEGEVGEGSNKFGAAWKQTTETAQFASDRFHAAMQSLAIGLGASILPAVTKVIDALGSFFVWLSAHQDLTKQLVIGLGILAGSLIAVGIAAFIAANAMTLGIGAAVAAIAFGLYELITHFQAVGNWLTSHAYALLALPIVGQVAGLA